MSGDFFGELKSVMENDKSKPNETSKSIIDKIISDSKIEVEQVKIDRIFMEGERIMCTRCGSILKNESTFSIHKKKCL